jgi:pimeloyl-ACP methyl ester carboxylesterase
MDTTKTVHRGRTAMLSLGVGVAGAAAAIMAAFRSDLRAARSRLAGQSRLVETACGPVEMAESGSGPPALVVHGMAGGFDMGLIVGRGVLGEDYRVIAPSRFGYLRTPLPANASHVAQADTLASLLDALGVPRAVVLAVSAGAQPATHLALRHPSGCGRSCSSRPRSTSRRSPESHPNPGHLASCSTTCWPQISWSGQ